ncbi:uncharacterized protein LOC119996731 [Tripterygium wilfordii]|uniref:uncharacterized protein LOC119996731 n=1 Tax=Tripterygium wilfordii TaxID=458696 RepID=UPI0018F8388A|nr:uncharacterized protein LOC119996731 [Tripterygium wilfordii]
MLSHLWQEQFMKISSMLLQLISLLCLLPQFVQSTTILVDGVSEWKDPSVHVGDTVIFEHKYHNNLYIFKNQNAFNLCNFTQSTLLTKPYITSYTWHPSRTGFFYFTFNNGSFKTCQDSQKLAVKVFALLSPASAPSSTTTPDPGGLVSSSHAYPWPSKPREAASSGPAPTIAPSPLTVPNLVPSKGHGIPFIYSNPAVPLPTGEVDSATIRPLPTSGTKQVVVVGLVAVQMGLFCAVTLLLL